VNDTTIGFLILGIGIVAVLATVFAVTLRLGRAQQRGTPPDGVHLPPPSWLPVVMAVGAALIGAGLAFRPDGWLAQPLLAVPGLVVLIGGIVGWIRAAGREWREVEHGSDHSSGH
jgi:tetrahydromethanopterin S-methyltransferase subunit E